MSPDKEVRQNVALRPTLAAILRICLAGKKRRPAGNADDNHAQFFELFVHIGVAPERNRNLRIDNRVENQFMHEGQRSHLAA